MTGKQGRFTVAEWTALLSLILVFIGQAAGAIGAYVQLSSRMTAVETEMRAISQERQRVEGMLLQRISELRGDIKDLDRKIDQVCKKLE